MGEKREREREMERKGKPLTQTSSKRDSPESLRLLSRPFSQLCTSARTYLSPPLEKGRGRSGSGPHKSRQTFMERVWLDIPFRGTPRASQMLKQLKYVGALGILTLAFQGPQPVEQKQTLWGFLLESSQLNHLLEHVIRVPSVESVGVIRVSSPHSSESLTGYGK